VLQTLIAMEAGMQKDTASHGTQTAGSWACVTKHHDVTSQSWADPQPSGHCCQPARTRLSKRQGADAPAKAQRSMLVLPA
jgi:hypothetical protein